MKGLSFAMAARPQPLPRRAQHAACSERTCSDSRCARLSRVLYNSSQVLLTSFLAVFCASALAFPADRASLPPNPGGGLLDCNFECRQNSPGVLGQDCGKAAQAQPLHLLLSILQAAYCRRPTEVAPVGTGACAADRLEPAYAGLVTAVLLLQRSLLHGQHSLAWLARRRGEQEGDGKDAAAVRPVSGRALRHLHSLPDFPVQKQPL